MNKLLSWFVSKLVPAAHIVYPVNMELNKSGTVIAFLYKCVAHPSETFILYTEYGKENYCPTEGIELIFGDDSPLQT